MTTYINFNPSPNEPFQFQPTLDGSVYNVIVTYNLFGQRYYVNIYTLDNTLVVCLPLIGSPPGRDISLTAGYFTTTLVYRVANAQFEVSE
jgi:hypothetical protein